MKKIFVLVLFGAIALVACTKASRNASHYAGSYDLYKYEIKYFNGDAVLDSTFVVEDVAQIGLYDNGSTISNGFAYSSTNVPRSWVDNGIGIPDSWYADGGRGKTITVSYNDPTAFGTFVIYDVEKDGFKKYKWSTVSLNSNNSLNYIETLYLKKN
jgi:hypothetical protein